MCFNYEVIKDRSRDPRVMINPSAVAADHNVLSEHKWYRFDSKYGGLMPRSCARENYCGTQSPGWLSGPHPSRESGPVRRDVCFRSASNCCLHKTKVYIRQCLGYYVYLFQEVPKGIKGRYCVEKSESKCLGVISTN